MGFCSGYMGLYGAIGFYLGLRALGFDSSGSLNPKPCYMGLYGAIAMY